jgi:hypothetical protein
LVGVPGLATLLERERTKLPEDATLLVTLNGDFLSGSELGERCKGCVSGAFPAEALRLVRVTTLLTRSWFVAERT